MNDIIKSLAEKIPDDKRDVIIEKVAVCKDVSDVISAAKTEGIELNDLEAKTVLDMFNNKIELSDTDIDQAAGGCSCSGACYDSVCTLQ